MSSKLKRKRQAQRLMRELEAESAAKANAIASARDLSNNLVAEVNHTRALASQVNQQQRHFERELARYKFIDDMLADVIDDMRRHPHSRHLPPLEYITSTTRYVEKAFPYLEVIQMPDIMDSVAEARRKDMSNQAAVQVFRLYAFEVHAEDRQRGYRIDPQAPECGITIAFDGDKYRTFMLPGYLLNVDEKTALNILRREIAPMFLREYRNMRQGVNRDGIKF